MRMPLGVAAAWKFQALLNWFHTMVANAMTIVM